MKRRWLSSVAAGFAVALYFVIVLPVQTYLACVEAPTFSLGDMLGEFVPYFALAWISASAVLFALSYIPLARATIDAQGHRRRKMSLQFHVLALAVVLAAILESGLLSFGLPKLNGDFAGYRSVARGWLDAATLVAMLVIPLLCYRWLKRHVVGISLAVAAFSALSLLDVSGEKKTADAGGNMIVHANIPRCDIVAESAFSPSNNVMVLILDTVSSHAMAEIFRQDPAFARHFPGFVNYVNNLGMHWFTSVALPGIMTGRHFENAVDMAAYGSAPFTGESFIKEYIDGDIPVYLNLALWLKGWSNRIAASQAPRTAARPSQTPVEATFQLCIGDLALFRVVPYCLKERVALAVASRAARPAPAKKTGRQRVEVYRDEMMWPLMASRPVDASFRATLHVHHTSGGHPPILRDENGESVSFADREPTFKDYVSYCKFVMKELAACLDAWQTNGVYDASTIIVVGDHGVGDAGEGWPETGLRFRDLPSAAFPALMVKAKGDRAPYSESTLPTSHARIAPLARALATKVLTRDAIAEALHAEERFCRDCVKGNITDWIVTGDWNVKKVVRRDVEKDASALRKLELDKTYSFLMTAPLEKYPDFIVHNGNRGTTCGLALSNFKMPMKVSFKAPRANKTYDMLLRIRFYRNTKGNRFTIVARSGSAAGSFTSDKSRDLRNYILLKGCRAGANGLIDVDFHYIGDLAKAAGATVCLMEMCLAEKMSENLAENSFFPGSAARAADFLQSWRVDVAFTRPTGGQSLSGSGKGLKVVPSKSGSGNGGQEVSLQGHALEGACRLASTGEGNVIIRLRGDLRKVEDRRLRVYADFESFKINGQEMLEEPVQTCFEAAHRIPLHVKDGEELDISVRLKRHRYGYVELRRLLLDAQDWTYQTEQSVDGLLTLPAMQEFLLN